MKYVEGRIVWYTRRDRIRQFWCRRFTGGHAWVESPGTEAPIYTCTKCDYRIGF